ncbi:MAG TPA: sulfur carrier protein ThiS [Actinomycetota bacterium]|jgi:sulfur carrier protein
MRVQLNGQPQDLPDGGLLADAFKHLGIGDPRGVAVALDGEVVPRSRWPVTRLTEGQIIEILRAVQGG